MKTRVITATVALLIFLPVLYFSGTWVFPLAIGLLAAVAGYEMSGCVLESKKRYVTFAAAIFAFLFTASARVVDFLPELAAKLPAPTLLFILIAVYVFYNMLITVAAFGKVGAKQIMTGAALTVFAAIAFYGFVSVRDNANCDYLLILIIAWMTDTFAIFGGKFFGKKKLCPNLSPKKTVAGMVSGIVGAVVGTVIYCLVMNIAFDGGMNYLLYGALAIPASLIAQLGDLSASAVKRDCGVKDYGKLFPGHGGVTDRFDSVMLLSVATMLFLMVAEAFDKFGNIL